MIAYYNDNEPYCCDVLRARIADGSLPAGDVDGRDIRSVQPDELASYRQIHLFAGIGGFALGLKWADWPEQIGVLTGGFPCKQTSVAAAPHGRRNGLAGQDSGLFEEMCRIIEVVRSEWVIVENPLGVMSWASEIARCLEGIGYAVSKSEIEVSDLGAPHQRRRVFFIANAHGKRLEITRPTRPSSIECSPWRTADRDFWREAEPGIWRMDDGLSTRMDRLRALGNAVVPQVVEVIARAILTAEKSGLASRG